MRGRTLVALVLLGFLAVATGVIWRRSYGIAESRAVHALEAQRTELRAREAQLERDIRAASSRARLVPIAESRLHMHVPSDRDVVILPETSPAEPPDAPR